MSAPCPHTAAAPLAPRTLRCANAALYLLMGLAAVGCAAWAIATGRATGAWQTTAAALAALTALLWGGSYTLLRWEIGPAGITAHHLLRRRHYPWHSLQNIHETRTDHNGVATYRLTLIFAQGTLTLSSQLISPDDLEQLRESLTAAALLHPPPRADAEWI